MQGGLKGKGARRRLAGALLAGISISGIVAGAPALAQDAAAAMNGETARFSIPAQPLSSALTVFGQQAGLQVSANAATVRGISAPALSGRLSTRAALGRLLSGSGLVWRSSGPRTVIVYDPAATAETADVSSGDTIALDRIVISGQDTGAGFQGTPDWVYSDPASVSVVSREQIEQVPVRNTRDLLDSVAGVYVNRSEAQNPGIVVNVRGLQDQNRVVTMIDGARQNFQRSGHGASQRAYVDTSFIREIDVEKAATTGVGGAGALGGTVNFRTIEAGDIIEAGRTWGVEASAGTGTNAFEFDGSVTAAARVSDRFSVVGGISHKKIGAYEIGKNGTLKLNEGLTYVDDVVVFTGQEVLTTFIKGEADLSDNLRITLSWMRNATKSSQGGYQSGRIDEDTEEITNNTIVANLAWNPDSDLIDLEANVWYNHLANDETRGFVLDPDVLFPVDYKMATVGGSLENTSRFDVAFGALSLNYGVEMFHDDGTTKADSDYLDSAYGNTGGTDLSLGFSGANPNGRRTMVSGFANVTLEHDDWLTVSGGLRYDYSRLWGSTTIYGDRTRVRVPCEPGDTSFMCRIFGYKEVNVYSGANVSVDRTDGALLPNAMVAVQPFDWLQAFARFSQTYRAPSVMEALIAGGHPPPALPINNAPNPDLKPERGNTYEIGANISRDGVFSEQDGFRLKAVAFYREIEDYISTGTVRRPEFDKEYTSYVNVDGTTRMSGVEIEASYDAGLYYLGGAFTWLHTDFGNTYTYEGATKPVEPSVIFVPPEFKVTLDGGVRLLDKRLTLGGRMNHVGGTSPNVGVLTASYQTTDYTLFDLYGSLKFNDHAKLRFGVNNLTDVAYVPALGTTAYPAPGRTITAAFNVKF
uniref:TonB-dependent receptor n=1 Tax=Stappia sp. TaxID=1870903 RepID=UPI003BAD0B97